MKNIKEKITKIFLTTSGLFFIFFGIFSMDFSIYRGNPGWIFWVCYASMVIIGFAILTKNSYLILIELNILAIPLLLWNIDFIYFLTTKTSLWGITNYFFDELIPTARFISFEHFFLAPLGLLALYLIKLKKFSACKWSFIQIILLFIVSRLFTQPGHNVNCVFTSCTTLLPSDAWHPVRWFLILGSFILLTNLIIYLIPIFRKK